LFWDSVAGVGLQKSFGTVEHALFGDLSRIYIGHPLFPIFFRAASGQLN